jgi:hypothetical protein
MTKAAKTAAELEATVSKIRLICDRLRSKFDL